MKLVSFEVAGAQSFGAVIGAAIVDLKRRTGQISLKQWIANGCLAPAAAELQEAHADHSLEAVRLLPVIPDPDKIFCIGMNYREHVAETGREVTEKPTLFSRYPASQVGHEQAIIRPIESDHLDYEGELAVVIGKAGRRIPEARALEHIAGYSCYNDASIRDWQRHTTQFLPGKNFESTGGFGPWLVTADEIAAPDRLTLVTRLNGQEVQRASTSQMIVTIPAQIAYISTFITLLPGDVIVTGTPGGVGSRRVPPLYMKPGDRVEVEIEKIGVLRNSIGAE